MFTLIEQNKLLLQCLHVKAKINSSGKGHLNSPPFARLFSSAPLYYSF